MKLNHECPLCRKIHEMESTPEPDKICPECMKKLNDKSYIIHWLEMVNPESVAYRLGIDFYDEEENPENYEKVLKEITDDLPPNSKFTAEVLGDWEFECFDVFEADNIEKAKQIALEDYDCEVFVVFDKNMKRLFDDTDLENLSIRRE